MKTKTISLALLATTAAAAPLSTTTTCDRDISLWIGLHTLQTTAPETAMSGSRDGGPITIPAPVKTTVTLSSTKTPRSTSRPARTSPSYSYSTRTQAQASPSETRNSEIDACVMPNGCRDEDGHGDATGADGVPPLPYISVI